MGFAPRQIEACSSPRESKAQNVSAAHGMKVSLDVDERTMTTGSTDISSEAAPRSVVKEGSPCLEFFGGLDPSGLSSVIKGYVARTYNEDLNALTSLVGSNEKAAERLCSSLRTTPERGIAAHDAHEMYMRRAIFGTNAMPFRRPTPFCRLVLNATTDYVLSILMIAGLVSLVLALTFGENKRVEWVDGTAIFLAVIIVVLVTAGNDYLKERQFAALREKNEKFCTVIRDGKTQKMKTDELLVGDVILVETGDELPADCLVLMSRQLSVDESSMTGESRSVRKASCFECVAQMKQSDASAGDTLTSAADKHHKIPSPVTLSGSIVMSGTGVMLVLAVGPHSEAGQLLQKLVIDTDPTSLQNKLNALARDIGNVGFCAAIVTFFIYILQFWISYAVSREGRNNLSPQQIFTRHIQFLVEAITILVVAIPEGLPLAVTLSLAFSVRRMLRDQNYVRRLAACETMGGASEICSDKTGTLTKNRMTVEMIWNGVKLSEYSWTKTGEQHVTDVMTYDDATAKATSIGKRYSGSMPLLPDFHLEILAHSIALNSTAYFEVPDQPADNENVVWDLVKSVGSPTECALLQLLHNLGFDYEALRLAYGDDTKIVHRAPFSSSRKLMTTVVRHAEDPTLYRVYVKGAAEIVLRLCRSRLDANGNLKEMDLTYRSRIESQVVDQMACQGLRTVCVAFKDFDPSKEPEWLHEADVSDPRYPTRIPRRRLTITALPLTPEKCTDVTLYNVELDLTCLVIVGMRDPVRDEVPAAVLRCQKAGIRVRMITGDNIETAKQIGIKCGIYHPEKGGVALTGPDFYRRIGGVVCETCRTETCDCPSTETEQRILPAGALSKHMKMCCFSFKSLCRDRGRPEAQKTEIVPSDPVCYTVKVTEASREDDGGSVLKSRSSEFEPGDNKLKPAGVSEQQATSEVVTSFSTSEITQARTESSKKVPSRWWERWFGTLSKSTKKLPILTSSRRVRVDVIKNLPAFAQLSNHLEILARSQPRDKYAMVLGLKSLGAVVAVTGDGTNDAPALKKADVGFAMGIAGKEVAKQAADIVLLDDNFESIVKAVKWGRSIYDNIRRFLQFQLTVNIVAVSTALIGSFVLGESPLSAVQLLWVNLIMDTFASLALATEPATDDLLSQQPHSRNEYLVNRLMMRNIIGQAIYQLTVILVLIFTGECWIPEHTSRAYSLFEGKNGFHQFSQTCGSGSTVTAGRRFRPFSQVEVYRRAWTLSIGPSRHYTVVFNTFVCLQIVNLVNARKIRNEWNVLSGSCSSPLWLIIIGIICTGQVILVHFGGRALNCHLKGLTVDQWLICIALALGSLVVGFFLHLIPAERLSCIPQTGKKEADILTGPTNLALASRGRISTDRLSTRLAAGLHNESRHRYYASGPLTGTDAGSGWVRQRAELKSPKRGHGFIYHSAPIMQVNLS